MQEFELLGVVAVLKDIPGKGLVRGQAGTIVEIHSPSVAEVEFSDDQGRAYAMAAIRTDEMIRLHHEPQGQVAWAASRQRLANVNIPSGAEARVHPLAFSARLKSCPDTKLDVCCSKGQLRGCGRINI